MSDSPSVLSFEHVSQVPITAKSPARFAAFLGEEGVSRIEKTAADMRQWAGGRTIWNVNSTAAGGGVAEMLHTLLGYVRGLGVDTRWAVISGNPDFFRITKRLHNALHGERGDGTPLDDTARRIYDEVTSANAAEFLRLVSPGDVVILHDPQTAGLAAHLAGRDVRVVWRCHIGDDRRTEEGDEAWSFLAPYLRHPHAFIFSRQSYIPDVCDSSRAMIVAPSIDPFSAKNLDLDERTVRAILAHIGVVSGVPTNGSVDVTLDDGTTSTVARRASVMSDGAAPGWNVPLVVQVSRWDALKDPIGVLEGFGRTMNGTTPAGAHLILAGPGVDGAADDPEGIQVFEGVVARWKQLGDDLRGRVHLVNLPMDDLRENAAMVNALQRHAAVVVQKSLREGFGLTVTEAMWKGRPVIASAVGGIQDQVEDGVSGLLLKNPSDLDGFAASLRNVLLDPTLGRRLGGNARRRVSEHFLGLRALAQYADLLQSLES